MRGLQDAESQARPNKNLGMCVGDRQDTRYRDGSVAFEVKVVGAGYDPGGGALRGV